MDEHHLPASTVPTRSPILAASRRYWRWLGRLLVDWANQLFGPKRRRSFFVFGGCLTWVLVAFFYLFAIAIFGMLVVAIVAALALVGVVLSAVGGIDQARISLMRR